MLTPQDLDRLIEMCGSVPPGQRGQILRRIAARTQQDRSHEDFVFRLHDCPVEYRAPRMGPPNVRYPKFRGPTLLRRVPLSFLTPALLYLWGRPLASFESPCHLFQTGRQYFRLRVPVRSTVPLLDELLHHEAAVAAAMDEIPELMTIRTAAFLACLKVQDALAMADDPSPFLVPSGRGLPGSAAKAGSEVYSRAVPPSTQVDTGTTASLRVLPLGR